VTPVHAAGRYKGGVDLLADDEEHEIDILNRTVRAGTSELHLTSLEQSLLYLMAANCQQSGYARGHPGHAVGRGLCRREQRGGPPDSQLAGATPERLACWRMVDHVAHPSQDRQPHGFRVARHRRLERLYSHLEETDRLARGVGT
jgi:hypothetical protein